MTSKSWIHDRQRGHTTRRSALSGRRWSPAGIALTALLIALVAPSAAMAQVTEGNSRTAANADGGASTLNVPAPTAAPGDLLLAQVTYEKGTETSVSPQGTGWSPVRTTSFGTDVGQAVYWKTAGVR